jgi:type IV secretion system protein VirD4
MKRLLAILFASVSIIAGFAVATQYVAQHLGHPSWLGPRIELFGQPVYAPWKMLIWNGQYGRSFPSLFAQAFLIVGASVLCSLLFALIAGGRGRVQVKELGRDKWAHLRDMQRAGLLTGRGTVIGEYHNRLLTFDGPEHQLVSGASRSGKGVGHVIPTLLNWPASVLAYDVKGELWTTTAGFRSRFSHCLFFNPTRMDSVRFNPLLEVRKGPHEVRDAQNIVEMLVNPDGSKTTLDIWDQQASQLLVALILHVLYTELDDRKHLGVVRRRLLDFRRTCIDMIEMCHRFNPMTRTPEPHPEIAMVAKELLSQPPKFQASVRGTAASYLTLFADEIVCRNIAVSDFTVADLACAEHPVTLYLQPPPSDAPRLKPLVRLILNQTCRALMEHLDRDGRGHPKCHRLLLMLDEFPTLGRLEFFQMNLRQMAGYGIKAHLIVQSFNDIIEQYGPHNSVIDNCHILVAFASADTTTQQRLSQMTGTVTEYRESYSGPRWKLASMNRTISQVEQVRPLLQPGDVRELPSGEQLLFVTGRPPMRTDKLRHYDHPMFRSRVLAPPDQAAKLDVPEQAPFDWTGERAKGERITSGLPADDPALTGGADTADSDEYAPAPSRKRELI